MPRLWAMCLHVLLHLNYTKPFKAGLTCFIDEVTKLQKIVFEDHTWPLGIRTQAWPRLTAFGPSLLSVLSPEQCSPYAFPQGLQESFCSTYHRLRTSVSTNGPLPSLSGMYSIVWKSSSSFNESTAARSSLLSYCVDTPPHYDINPSGLGVCMFGVT